MADFNKAYKITLGHEGGYVNDPADRGGETYKGISRKNWPDWRGWDIIDGFKQEGWNGEASILENDLGSEPVRTYLENETMSFYRHHFWNKLHLDNCNNHKIANEMFDTAVNQGIATATKYLQRSLNLLNRDEHDWQDLKVDGNLGPRTLITLNYAIDKGSRWITGVLKCLNGEQYIRYRALALISSKQRKFFHGWLKRIHFNG